MFKFWNKIPLEERVIWVAVFVVIFCLLLVGISEWYAYVNADNVRNIYFAGTMDYP